MPRGDLLDEMIGQYINQANCPVPIKKLGNGYYIFGTRKIYAKILNGKLVIRVGGGYMVIEEFISTYAEQELNKINKMNEKTDEEDDVDSLDLTPASRGGSSKEWN
jgi:Growth-Arrest-Specific Protein 2 Domain